MKRIYCDCCGREMDYKEKAVEYTNGQMFQRSTGGKLFGIKITVEPAGVRNGDHVDICGDCRWDLIDKLDPRPQETATGGHP